jgi:hypothetical protein
VGKPEGRRPLGNPRRRLEDNIKMDLTEVGWRHGLDRSGPGQGQVADSFQYGDETSGNFLSSLGRVSFSGGSVPWC